MFQVGCADVVCRDSGSFGVVFEAFQEGFLTGASQQIGLATECGIKGKARGQAWSALFEPGI